MTFIPTVIVNNWLIQPVYIENNVIEIKTKKEQIMDTNALAKFENVENKTTLPTYEYPEPRYFLDYSISPEYGDEPPRWVRMPMMSSLNVQKIMREVFYPVWKNKDVMYAKSGVYKFRVQLEEHLDEEVTDNDGKGLGYTYREHHFGGLYQEFHEEMFEDEGFEGWSKQSNSNWDDV